MPFDVYRAQGEAEPFSGQERLIGVQRREGTWQPLTLLLPIFVSRKPKMAIINEQRASHYRPRGTGAPPSAQEARQGRYPHLLIAHPP